MQLSLVSVYLMLSSFFTRARVFISLYPGFASNSSIVSASGFSFCFKIFSSRFYLQSSLLARKVVRCLASLIFSIIAASCSLSSAPSPLKFFSSSISSFQNFYNFESSSLSYFVVRQKYISKIFFKVGRILVKEQ